jgi:hypothetical protein
MPDSLVAKAETSSIVVRPILVAIPIRCAIPRLLVPTGESSDRSWSIRLPRHASEEVPSSISGRSKPSIGACVMDDGPLLGLVLHFGSRATSARAIFAYVEVSISG